MPEWLSIFYFFLFFSLGFRGITVYRIWQLIYAVIRIVSSSVFFFFFSPPWFLLFLLKKMREMRTLLLLFWNCVGSEKLRYSKEIWGIFYYFGFLNFEACLTCNITFSFVLMRVILLFYVIFFFVQIACHWIFRHLGMNWLGVDLIWL